MNENNEYLEQLEYFFDADLRIKRLLVDCAPTETDNLDADSRIKYFDKLHRALGYINSTLSSFVKGPFFLEDQFWDYSTTYSEDGIPHVEFIESRVPYSFDKKMQEIKRKLIASESSNRSLRESYNDSFAKMDDNLIKQVKQQIIGENLDEHEKVANLISSSSSINEILHILHSHMLNNREVLDSLPIIDIKRNLTYPNSPDYSRTILAGVKNNTLAKEVFNTFSLNPHFSYAYIVGLDDRTLMMVKDAGHCLTMQIQEDASGNVRTEYFIPKVIDADIINSLPVTEHNLDYETGTDTGLIISSREEAADTICSFVDLIPSDGDREWRLKLEQIIGNKDQAFQLLERGEVSPENLLLTFNNTGYFETTSEEKKRVAQLINNRRLNNRNKSINERL